MKVCDLHLIRILGNAVVCTCFRALSSIGLTEEDETKLLRRTLSQRTLSNSSTTMDWNSRLGLSTILTNYTPPKVLKEYFPGGYFGIDKEGYPVFIDPMGQIDFKGMLHSVKTEDVLKHRGYIAEVGLKLGREQSEKLGKEINQCTIIMDLEGLGMKHLWRPGVNLFNTMATMFEEQYPTLMKRAIVVKAPRIFPIAYSLVKPFLREDTKKKVVILGGNWKTDLLKYIDADQLPEYYGGTCRDEDGDPKCLSKICYAGDIPHSYYVKTDDIIKSDDFKVRTIHAGDVYEIPFKVTTPGSILQWEFTSEGYDIGFGVFLVAESKKTGEPVTELVALDKRSSHLVPEDGGLTCEKIGTYTVKFDNSYSWTRSKKLHYNVKVIEPDNLN